MSPSSVSIHRPWDDTDIRDSQYWMSNTNASEDDNVESPSIYGNTTYKDYRKKEKNRKAADGRNAELEEIREDNIETAKRQKSKIMKK
jgi:hypothetical protein